jgi:predicted nuclease of predicted toxin-antitoxin system
MRLLLDESLPRSLKQHLPGHHVQTVQELGWAGKKNGALLALAEGRFDVFLTPDRNLPMQQNLQGLRLSVMILRARSNNIRDLTPLAPEILAALATLSPGQLVRLGS